MAKHLTLIQQKKATATLIALWEHDNIPQAAAALGISRAALYERIKSYNLDEKLAEMHEAGRLVLQQGTRKAAENVVSKIDSDDEKISLQASTEVLDRTGLTKPDKGGGTTVIFNTNGNSRKYINAS